MTFLGYVRNIYSARRITHANGRATLLAVTMACFEPMTSALRIRGAIRRRQGRQGLARRDTVPLAASWKVGSTYEVWMVYGECRLNIADISAPRRRGSDTVTDARWHRRYIERFGRDARRSSMSPEHATAARATTGATASEIGDGPTRERQAWNEGLVTLESKVRHIDSGSTRPRCASPIDDFVTADFVAHERFRLLHAPLSTNFIASRRQVPSAMDAAAIACGRVLPSGDST